jgi:hypothetical protein
MKGFKAFIDNTIGVRGRVVVTDDKTDREVILKTPFLLRVRCWLAARRIAKRARKLAKFNKRHT